MAVGRRILDDAGDPIVGRAGGEGEGQGAADDVDGTEAPHRLGFGQYHRVGRPQRCAPVAAHEREPKHVEQRPVDEDEMLADRALAVLQDDRLHLIDVDGALNLRELAQPLAGDVGGLLHGVGPALEEEHPLANTTRFSLLINF